MAVAVEVAGSDRVPSSAPDWGSTVPPPIKLFPFISQIATWPLLVFCHRMSEWPSPLKSPVPIACQAGPGLGLTGSAADHSCSRSFPRSRPGRCCVLPQDVGMAVAVEVARSDRFPARARIGADRPAADQLCSRSCPRSRPDRSRSATGCRNGRRR